MTGLENMIICRCEEVTFGQLKATANEHKCNARELKLRTRAGMGFCGGRTCRISVDRMIESVIPYTPQDHLPLRHQPPVRPVTFGTVGDLK